MTCAITSLYSILSQKFIPFRFLHFNPSPGCGGVEGSSRNQPGTAERPPAETHLVQQSVHQQKPTWYSRSSTAETHLVQQSVHQQKPTWYSRSSTAETHLVQQGVQHADAEHPARCEGQAEHEGQVGASVALLLLGSRLFLIQ